jgi:hypothetical protein
MGWVVQVRYEHTNVKWRRFVLPTGRALRRKHVSSISYVYVSRITHTTAAKVQLKLISTTPGIEVLSPTDSVMEPGYRNGDMYKKEMEASLHWRAPGLHIENARVYSSVSFGFV